MQQTCRHRASFRHTSHDQLGPGGGFPSYRLVSLSPAPASGWPLTSPSVAAAAGSSNSLASLAGSHTTSGSGGACSNGRDASTGCSPSHGSRLAFLPSLVRQARHSGRVRAHAAAPFGPLPGASAEGPRVEEPSTALLLAWFACSNRSLFAAQCLVEVVAELYREGRSFEELQLSLKMATQAGGSRVRAAAAADAGGEEGGYAPGEQVMAQPLLQSQDEDVAVSWVALIFLTLEELGVPRDKEPRAAGQGPPGAQAAEAQGAGSGPGQSQESRAPLAGGLPGAGEGGGMAAGSAYLRGMLGYVRQTLGMYDEGQTLARVAGLQGLVQQSSGAASSPFLVLMQQYTRLVLLTVEVVAAAGLATTRPLRRPETVLQPSGYSDAFTGACSAVDALLDGPSLPSPAAAADLCPSRGLAIRLLMAFTGAVLGSPWSLGKFVEAVRVAYDQGLAADELFSQLEDREFVQSGGLLPLAPSGGGDGGGGSTSPSPPPVAPQYEITKALLSAWISLSYMTLAQMGVPYPAAGQRLGWAWAGFGDPIEAIGMNDFVGNVLRQMAGADPRVVPQEPEEEPQPGPAPGADIAGSTSEAPSVSVASSTAGEVTLSTASEGVDEATAKGAGSPGSPGSPGRRRAEAHMVRVEDDSLQTTSTAFRVLSQQVALVQAVCRDVVTESQG